MLDCLIYDLVQNNFSRTKSLGRVIEAVPEAIDTFNKMRQEEVFNHSRVIRCKHDGTYRNGSDLSASAHDRYLSHYQVVQELYFKACGEFIGRTTFNPLLCFGATTPSTPHAAHQLWLDQIDRQSCLYGNWTIFIDIENFYPTITSRRLADIIEQRLGFDIYAYFRLLDTLESLGGRPPQGYLISDLLSAVVLAPLDRFIDEQNIGACHYSDDVAISGPSKPECIEMAGKIQEFLAGLGFRTNARKVCVERPEHLPWVLKGDRWGSFPVESYLPLPGTKRHISQNPSPGIEEKDLDDETLEEGYEAIYSQYSEPPKKPESEYVHRQALRAVAALNPERILRDASALSERRTSDIALILSGLKQSDHKAIAAYSCRNMRGNDGAEDAVATILERLPQQHRESFVPRIAKNKMRTPALRRAMLDFCPRNAWSIDYFFERLPRAVSLSEAVAYHRLSIETGGREGKYLSSVISNITPSLGAVREIVEDAISRGAFNS